MVEYDWQLGIQNIPWLWLRQTEHIWRHSGRVRLTTSNTEHTLIVITTNGTHLKTVVEYDWQPQIQNILIWCTLCLRYLLSIILASVCVLFHVITHVLACRQTYLLFWHTIWKQTFPDFVILKIRYQLTNLVYSTRRNIIDEVLIR